ncbi:MAG: hypothetical protein R3F07_09210 [Opitutaceae bacterium]
MKRNLFVLLISALAGCSAIPDKVPYHPLDPEGGYSALHVGKDTWQVRFTGNQYLAGSTVRELAFLTCADLAEEAGYDWFIVTEEINESAHILEGTTFSGVARPQVSSGWSGGVDGLTGSQTTQDRFIPQFFFEIRCFHAKPDVANSHEAKAVLESLREKYAIPPRLPKPGTS